MDNDSFNYNDWREQNLRPLEFWQSKLNEKQIRLLDEVKKRFNDELDRFSEIYREQIQIDIDMHVSNWAKLELLESRHSIIVNDNIEVLRHYRKALNSDNIINDEFYNEFIMSFGVIGLRYNEPIEENEVKAMNYLENVAMLNILERMIQLAKDDIIYGNQRFEVMDDWQIVLHKLGNRFDYKNNKYPNVKYTIINLFMRNNHLLNTVSDLTYIDYVRDKFEKEFKKNKFKRLSSHITDQHETYKGSVTQLNKILQFN